MAQPSTREELSQYCLRQLGAPVLEINLADEQIDDLIDDALQYFYERHFDGAERSYIKYQITQADIDRGKRFKRYSCRINYYNNIFYSCQRRS